jgi:hypothetical protein
VRSPRYSAWLAAHDRTPPHEPDAAGHAFLRYPLRVRERDTFVDEADRRDVCEPEYSAKGVGQSKLCVLWHSPCGTS